MTQAESETLYQVLDQSATILQQTLHGSYFEALLETGDNLNAGEVQVVDGVPSQQQVEQLEQLYRSVDLAGLSAETIRQALQLALLKATHDDRVAPTQQMTPDSIGMIVADLIQKLLGQPAKLSLLDLGVGTGNLLSTVINQVTPVDGQVQGYGVDNDDDLLAIAAMSTAMQRLSVELFHQDAIDDLVVPAVDVAISDLPVGYYPLDDRTKGFATRAKKGHSYVHHLLIEQAMRHVRPGGWGIFLVPTTLFQSAEAQGLLRWMSQAAYLQGLLNLPQKLFLDAASQKSLVILQNHGGTAKQAAKVLLGEYPDFQDARAVQNFAQEIDSWVSQNVTR